MNKTENENPTTFVAGRMVYCVTVYGRLYGIFEKAEDASQIWSTFINKGQVAEMSNQIIK